MKKTKKYFISYTYTCILISGLLDRGFANMVLYRIKSIKSIIDIRKIEDKIKKDSNNAVDRMPGSPIVSNISILYYKEVK